MAIFENNPRTSRATIMTRAAVSSALGVLAAILTMGFPLLSAQTSAPQSKRAVSKPQASTKILMSPDGHPDLSGIWVYNGNDPFEAADPSRGSGGGRGGGQPRKPLVVDPADGKAPLLPSAEKWRDYNTEHINDSWEFITPWERCITRGVPGAMLPGAYDKAFEIIQAAGVVGLVAESM